MDIKVAGEADFAGLLSLYGQLHPKDEMTSTAVAATNLKQLVNIKGSAVYVGEIDSKLVTSCTLIVIPNLTRSGRPYALIENVITDTMHRKHGFGGLIVRHAVTAAFDQDCYKVMLLTGSSDPTTLRFYEHIGFEQSKTGFQIRRRA